MANNAGPVRRFFSGIGRILSVTRAVLSALFSLVFILFFFALLASVLGGQQLSIPDNGALRIEISGNLVDQRTYSAPLNQFVTDIPREQVVRELVLAVQHAATDEHINSIILVLHDMSGGGTSKIQEFGRALEAFKATGKPVIATSDNYNQMQYLLASYADEILIDPMGSVDLRGFAIYRTYFGEALDKLSVNVNVFRTGEHKDAVEPYIASSMSDASRAQNQLLLDDIWQIYAEDIINRRNLNPEQFTYLVENLDAAIRASHGDTAQLAIDYGLVDRIVTRAEALSYNMGIAGANADEDFYSYVDVGSYFQLEQLGNSRDNKPLIGVVTASGIIYEGVQPPGSIGGDSFSHLLRQTRLHDDLAALVVRVDSPGGSAFASELIRREIDLFREKGIPVVVSMGSVAASGGYWIATAADEIVATPSTLTGSIGVYSLLPTLEDSLARLGISSDGVRTSPLAGNIALDRALDERAKSMLQSQVDYIYAQFLELVASARALPIDSLEPIAGGRVWSGRQAMQHGLVDQLGDQQDAIDAAARLAGVDDYEVKTVEAPLSFAERLLQIISRNVSSLVQKSSQGSLVQSLLNILITPAENFPLTDPGNLYLYCSSCSASNQI